MNIKKLLDFVKYWYYDSYVKFKRCLFISPLPKQEFVKQICKEGYCAHHVKKYHDVFKVDFRFLQFIAVRYKVLPYGCCLYLNDEFNPITIEYSDMRIEVGDLAWEHALDKFITASLVVNILIDKILYSDIIFKSHFEFSFTDKKPGFVQMATPHTENEKVLESLFGFENYNSIIFDEVENGCWYTVLQLYRKQIAVVNSGPEWYGSALKEWNEIYSRLEKEVDVKEWYTWLHSYEATLKTCCDGDEAHRILSYFTNYCWNLEYFKTHIDVLPFFNCYTPKVFIDGRVDANSKKMLVSVLLE